MIKINYSRPFLSYEEQINKLKSEYNLTIDNNEFAIHALSTMSYYDLVNGYQDIFIKDGKYVDGFTIEHLYSFHLFDKKFQNILFRQSVLIENMFKTRLAQVIAKNMGVHQNDYLNSKHYFRHAKYDKTIQFIPLKKYIEKTYNKDIKYVHQPTKHYLENHNHIPPWILFKNITFGNIINLYKLLKPKEKSEITNEMITINTISYSDKVEFLTNSLNIIRSFRNQIAHNLRVVTYRSSNKLAPKVLIKMAPSQLYINADIKEKVGINDMYAMILSIVILLDNPFLIQDFLNEILINISSPNNPMLKDEERGIPESLYEDYSNITSLPLDLTDRINKLIINTTGNYC